MANNNNNNQRNLSRKGRIVIRNLSYKANEETLKNFFAKYGEIKEVAILRFEDGRMKGVAFLQYDNLLSALKAIKECNMKPFLGRPLAVDLAVSKDRFNMSHPKHKSANDEEVKHIPHLKQEDADMEDTATEELKPLSPIKNEIPLTVDSKFKDINDEDSSEEEDSDDEMDVKDIKNEDDEDDDMENGSSSKSFHKDSDPNFAHNPVSRDVTEGKTLFFRNISFEASESQMKELLSQFGKLKYVQFCRDKITKKFRGSAFVQFLDKDSAEECLQASQDPAYKEQFQVGGRTMFVHQAVGRESVGKKLEEKKKDKEPKDKRNMYLAREGVVRGGTKPAADVSKNDLALRTRRELMKRKLLANLNTVVSTTRLFICNLPLDLEDKPLRTIFLEYSDPEAVIKECRIMRNFYELDNDGKPRSKGHAFVTFTEHKHALKALRNINNNPDIFTVKQRPVVEFSLENAAALKAKANRMQKSRDKNSNKLPKKAEPSEKAEANAGPTKNRKETTKTSDPEFMGSNYDPNKKGAKAFHSHIGPKIRQRDSKSKGTGKITRNKINNQVRASRGVKRGRNGPKQPGPKKTAPKKSASKAKKSVSNGKKSKESGQKKKKRKFI